MSRLPRQLSRRRCRRPTSTAFGEPRQGQRPAVSGRRSAASRARRCPLQRLTPLPITWRPMALQPRLTPTPPKLLPPSTPSAASGATSIPLPTQPPIPTSKDTLSRARSSPPRRLPRPGRSTPTMGGTIPSLATRVTTRARRSPVNHHPRPHPPPPRRVPRPPQRVPSRARAPSPARTARVDRHHLLPPTMPVSLLPPLILLVDPSTRVGPMMTSTVLQAIPTTATTFGPLIRPPATTSISPVGPSTRPRSASTSQPPRRATATMISTMVAQTATTAEMMASTTAPSPR